jgi:hypothetical protein
MRDPSLGAPPSVGPSEDRLDSRKEIAAYLNRDVTTVQRWEKREGMPVPGICTTGWARSTLSGLSWMPGLVAGIFEQRRRTGTRVPRLILLWPHALRYRPL